MNKMMVIMPKAKITSERMKDTAPFLPLAGELGMTCVVFGGCAMESTADLNVDI